MKQPFMVEVEAVSANDAFKVAQGKRELAGKELFKLVDAGFDPTVSIHGKLARVRENPGLYSDKEQMLRKMLAMFDASPRGPRNVAELMIADGDAWTENPRAARVIRLDPARFLVFGNLFL